MQFWARHHKAEQEERDKLAREEEKRLLGSATPGGSEGDSESDEEGESDGETSEEEWDEQRRGEVRRRESRGTHARNTPDRKATAVAGGRSGGKDKPPAGAAPAGRARGAAAGPRSEPKKRKGRPPAHEEGIEYARSKQQKKGQGPPALKDAPGCAEGNRRLREDAARQRRIDAWRREAAKLCPEEWRLSPHDYRLEEWVGLEMDLDDMYEAERIVAERTRRGRKEYLVKWWYWELEDLWEPSEGRDDLEELVENWEKDDKLRIAKWKRGDPDWDTLRG